jgi:hypothetical protein
MPSVGAGVRAAYGADERLLFFAASLGLKLD